MGPHAAVTMRLPLIWAEIWGRRVRIVMIRGTRARHGGHAQSCPWLRWRMTPDFLAPEPARAACAALATAPCLLPAVAIGVACWTPTLQPLALRLSPAGLSDRNWRSSPWKGATGLRIWSGMAPRALKTMAGWLDEAAVELSGRRSPWRTLLLQLLARHQPRRQAVDRHGRTLARTEGRCGPLRSATPHMT